MQVFESGLWIPQEILCSFNTNKLDPRDRLFHVLRKSYDRLPSHNHQLMFLDAALILRGRPAAHLTALWEGALFDGFTSPNGENEDFQDFQRRKLRCVADNAKQQLKELHGFSLIKFDHDSDSDLTNPRR